jgi:hypothetical protein
MKNDHMTHIEEYIFLGSVDKVRESISFLRDLRNMMTGEDTANKYMIKWDGAPAIFMGNDPADSQFFVAKKSILNVVPIVYKSEADIKKNLNGNLQSLFLSAFKYGKKLGIKNIIQGDFLYDDKILKIRNTDLEFQPNTVAYRVEKNTDLGKKILKSKIGIAWHTEYKGKDLKSIQARFGFDPSILNKSEEVCSFGSNLSHKSTKLRHADLIKVNDNLHKIGKIFQKIESTTLKQLESNADISKFIREYNNHFIRNGVLPDRNSTHSLDIIEWISYKYIKQIDKLKTEEGKGRKRDKLNEIVKFFDEDNKKNLDMLYQLYFLIIETKLILISSFSNLEEVKTFVKTKDGYKVSNHEGFVAVKSDKRNAIKLIDRLEFSYNNFSKDIIKGWY